MSTLDRLRSQLHQVNRISGPTVKDDPFNRVNFCLEMFVYFHNKNGYDVVDRLKGLQFPSGFEFPLIMSL